MTEAAEIRYHPLSNIFPLLEGDGFMKLVEDIRSNGLREPVELYDGRIIDGRNRYRACIAAQVPVRYSEFRGKDAFAFVVSRNLHRRHLSAEERLDIGERIVKWGAIPVSAVAKEMKVSQNALEMRVRIAKKGDPTLVAAVRKGDVNLKTGSRLVHLSKEDQKAFVESKQRPHPVEFVRSKLNDKRVAAAAPDQHAAPSKAATEHDHRIPGYGPVGPISLTRMPSIIREFRQAAILLELIYEHVRSPKTQTTKDALTAKQLREFIEISKLEGA